jgi:hypothetical protein
MKSPIGILCMVSALVIAGIPAQGATRHHSQNIVVNSPSQFPALAQIGAEALYLHELGDGRAMLYVEDHGGRALSILDVTNPAAIKLVGHAEIAAKGPFDFVPDLMNDGALIRYREGSGFALIDFKHWMRPSIVEVAESVNATNTDAIGTHGLLLASNSVMPAPTRAMQTYDVVDTSDFSQPIRLATIQAVTQRVSKSDTGTIFLLNPSGITVVRRPGAEQRASEAENSMN